jgi:nitrite reductase (NADH) small subunit
MSEWQEIGRLEDIPRLGARVLNSPLGDIAVFRTARDEIFALRDRCPHRGGPLSQGIVHGTRVTCPLHNWVFELGDGQAVAPDRGCAPSFGVRVEGERVFVRVGAVESVESDHRAQRQWA